MDLYLWLATIGAFVAVAAFTGTMTAVALSYTSPERRRLRMMTAGAASARLPSVAVLEEKPAGLAGRVATYVPKSPREMSRLRRRLARAGWHGPTPAIVYAVAELTMPVLLGLAAWILLDGGFAWIGAAVAAVVGYMVPGLVVERRVALRKRQIQNGLPDALDLLIVCLEAGSSLDQGLVKASDELGIAYPALAEELRFITVETRAGKPRLEAFRNFAQRTGVDDVRALVSMLVQTDRFGTSVAQALRTHAGTARTKRRQRAEERAAKIGVKLVFPLVLCLFPAFYVVTIGPAVIQFIRVFFEQMVAQ